MARMRAELVARGAYRLILRRPIDPGALAQWRERLVESDNNLVSLVNSLVVSDEYRHLVGRPQWADAVMLNYLHQERCRLVRNLPAAEVIVDLGGATPNDPRGALVIMGYPHRFRTLTIVDVPPNESLEQRSARTIYDTVPVDGGTIRYVYGHMRDLAALHLPPASVDLVWMGQSIEHVPEGDLGALLPSIRAMLKPGGWFCLDTPNRRVTRVQVPQCYIHPDHRIEYEVGQLRDKLVGAGFEVQRVRGIGRAVRSCETGMFSAAEVIDNAALNEDAEHSYVMYLELRRSPAA